MAITKEEEEKGGGEPGSVGIEILKKERAE